MPLHGDARRARELINFSYADTVAIFNRMRTSRTLA